MSKLMTGYEFVAMKEAEIGTETTETIVYGVGDFESLLEDVLAPNHMEIQAPVEVLEEVWKGAVSNVESRAEYLNGGISREGGEA